jgi:hypothetical protein
MPARPSRNRRVQEKTGIKLEQRKEKHSDSSYLNSKEEGAM